MSGERSELGLIALLWTFFKRSDWGARFLRRTEVRDFLYTGLIAHPGEPGDVRERDLNHIFPKDDANPSPCRSPFVSLPN
jgi:hypothetical protein